MPRSGPNENNGSPVVATIPMQDALGVAVTPDRSRAYVTEPAPIAVGVIDTASGLPLAPISVLSGPCCQPGSRTASIFQYLNQSLRDRLYMIGKVLNALFSCGDCGSGIDSCLGPRICAPDPVGPSREPDEAGDPRPQGEIGS